MRVRIADPHLSRQSDLSIKVIEDNYAFGENLYPFTPLQPA